MTEDAPDARAATTRAAAPGDSAALVEFERATFAYDGRTAALSDVTARILPGEAHALIGPNGSGKSTLLKGMLGLVPLIGGRMHVLGTDPRRAARRIGYMPQTDEIDPEFPVTLRQVVMMGRYRSMGPFRFPRHADRESVDAAIDRVGLAAQARQHFGALSGGQQQRGMLARALVARPRLLLLDEPFNGLDQRNRLVVLRLMRELRDDGVGILVSTHDFEIATDACSHVLLLNRTQIAAGPVAATLTSDLLDETFGDATADDEAHGHFHAGHGHYHDTGFRGTRDQHGAAEAHDMDAAAEAHDMDAVAAPPPRAEGAAR